MFCVILTKGAGLVDCKEFDRYEDARKEYRRQVRNAWRRKSAWSQVQFHYSYSDSLERMHWQQKDGAYNLELTIIRPGWVDVLETMGGEA